uniref:Uncharacterized protein n=1 Tax=Coccidioides posadasii RMSCC 3488 TaxID=454284 RepID=A0A0J6F5X6_COCPO|nr:hypothetical protein CPAG_01934 [Coccidioides posadasii RMSCC 3488]
MVKGSVECRPRHGALRSKKHSGSHTDQDLRSVQRVINPSDCLGASEIVNNGSRKTNGSNEARRVETLRVASLEFTAVIIWINANSGPAWRVTKRWAILGAEE